VAVLIVLFGSWLLFRGVGAAGFAAMNTWQYALIYALALMFAFTGVAHFNKMKYELERMVPSIFPKPMLIIYLTGVFELLGAVGLLLPQFRSVAGTCLILLLLAMFPANIKAAREKLTLAGRPATELWLRAPMQILFITLLWWVSQPLSWTAMLAK
jgi:uncharacterized membrane protein